MALLDVDVSRRIAAEVHRMVDRSMRNKIHQSRWCWVAVSLSGTGRKSRKKKVFRFWCTDMALSFRYMHGNTLCVAFQSIPSFFVL